MRLGEITRTNKRARRWGKQSFNYAKTLAADRPGEAPVGCFRLQGVSRMSYPIQNAQLKRLI